MTADETKTLTVSLDEVDLMALRPLTRIKYSAAAVQRAEEALHQARLAHVDAILAARRADHSLAQIGQALGISRQRVHALIVWGEEERREHGN